MATTKKNVKKLKNNKKNGSKMGILKVFLILAIVSGILSCLRYELVYSDSFAWKLKPVEKENPGLEKIFTNLDNEIKSIADVKKDELSARFAFIVWLNERKNLKNSCSEGEWQKIFDRVLKNQKRHT